MSYPFKLTPPTGPLLAYERTLHVTSGLRNDLIPGVGWRQIQDGWNHDRRVEIDITVDKVRAVWRIEY